MVIHEGDWHPTFKAELDEIAGRVRSGQDPSREDIERLGLLGLLDLAQSTRPTVRARALRDLMAIYGIDGRQNFSAGQGWDAGI